MKTKSSRPRYAAIAAVFVLAIAQPAHSSGPEDIVVDRFSRQDSSGGTPAGWQKLEFKKIPKHTQYSVIQEENNFYLKADSRQSASGLYKEIKVNPIKYPSLSWRWKVESVLKSADATKKSGDDFAARVYVAFKYNPAAAGVWEKAKYGAIKKLYGKYPPKGALNYVWDNKQPEGNTFDNPYTDRAKMIIVRSGNALAGQWALERVNIDEDYRKLFGAEPPEIEFIAVMTDTDNTGESAVAYFDDIVLKARDAD